MEDHNAVCLDGSVGIYYLRRGFGDGEDKWIIWHKGGGWCTDLDNCFSRTKNNLGSSSKMPDSIKINSPGFLQND